MAGAAEIGDCSDGTILPGNASGGSDPQHQRFDKHISKLSKEEIVQIGQLLKQKFAVKNLTWINTVTVPILDEATFLRLKGVGVGMLNHFKAMGVLFDSPASTLEHHSISPVQSQAARPAKADHSDG